MLEIRGIWLCHMSRWDRYVLRPRIWVETPRSGTVPHIGPYTLASLKFMLTLPIKRRPLSLFLMVLMLIGVCLLVYAMPLLLFRDVCLQYFMVSMRRLWKSSWTISLSMELPLTTVSTILIKFWRDARIQT